MIEKTEGAIQNGQSRETGNIGQTRYRTKTIQRNWQHWGNKTPDEEKDQNTICVGHHYV